MKELEEFMETNTGSQVGMSVSAVAFSNASTVSHTSDRLLELDPGTCTDALGRQEFGIRHTVADHPLLSLEAIAELADSLPSGAVERHEANQPLLVPDGCPDLSGPPSETVRTIETNGRWMVLWNIEQVAAYRRLLDAILDEAVPFLPAREGGMGRREAFLFLSAPRAVTPVHFDPEHNFLLQIRGLKEIHVGRFPDREWERRELDRYHNGGHRNLVEIPPRSNTFRMQPGDGVYLYPWVPHWVYNGPAVSISLSITFRTRRSERVEFAHLFNGRLRRRGLSPRPAGESEYVDRVKAGLTSLVAWLLRGCRRQRGARDYG
ncbi:MAG: transcriptional regulator [Nitrospirae bacterium]|nr:MAG: transcriptional regulator [Nitrospirota bacterium]